METGLPPIPSHEVLIIIDTCKKHSKRIQRYLTNARVLEKINSRSIGNYLLKEYIRPVPKIVMSRTLCDIAKAHRFKSSFASKLLNHISERHFLMYLASCNEGKEIYATERRTARKKEKKIPASSSSEIF